MPLSVRVGVVRRQPRRQLDPGVAAGVVDRILRRRKARIGESSDRDGDTRGILAFFGVEYGRPADGAEPEAESGAGVAGSDILGGDTGNAVGAGETGKGGEDAAGPTLARQTVTDADSDGLARNLNAELAAGSGGGARAHSTAP